MCLVRGTLPYDLWDEKSENANKWFSLQSQVNVSTLIFSVIHSWSKCSEEKNTIHQRLSLHTSNCPSSSWGLTYCKMTRKEELGESHRCIIFLVYKPFHVLVFAVCERERERGKVPYDLWMNEWKSEKSENANKWFSLQSQVNVSTLNFPVIHSWSKCSEEKNTIHQRLSLHTRNSPASS